MFFGLSVGYPGENLEVFLLGMFELSSFRFRRKHKANRKVKVQLSPVSIRSIDWTVSLVYQVCAISLKRGREDESCSRKRFFFD
jgi:hypothetical protein